MRNKIKTLGEMEGEDKTVFANPVKSEAYYEAATIRNRAKSLCENSLVETPEDADENVCSECGEL